MGFPMGRHRFHRPVRGVLRHAHIEGSLIRRGRIPMKSDMAVRLIIGENRTGHIVQLYVVALPDHQHIVSVSQQLVPKDFRHREGHIPFQRPVGKGHAGGYRRGHHGSGSRRTSRHLRGFVRMAVGFHRFAAGGSMSGIDADGLSLAVLAGALIINRLSAVDG